MRSTDRRVAGSIATLEASYYDFTKDGEGHYRFHPTTRPLPPACELLPLSEFGSTSEHLQHAQARYSLISHHSGWMQLAVRMRQAGVREMVRFVAVSQKHAGAFLNAVPARGPFRMPTWAMRISVQRRLGLPLTEAAGRVAYESRGGRVFDALGDVAQNDGEGGRALDAALRALV